MSAHTAPAVGQRCAIFLLIVAVWLITYPQLCSSAVSDLRTNSLFNDTFDVPLFTSQSKWLHRQATTLAQLENGKLTFQAFDGSLEVNGDIFTKVPYRSSTNQFLLRFDFGGANSCNEVYVAWFFNITNAIHGWCATSRESYCAADSEWYGGCDQNWQLLRTDSPTIVMRSYAYVLALANYQVVSRDEAKISQGIYISLQNRGGAGCYFDNFSLEEILPPLDSTDVSAPSFSVDFPLLSPSFEASSPQIEDTKISGNFARLVELTDSYQVRVMRDFPATEYDVQPNSNSIVTISRTLQVYEESSVTCEFTFQAFDKSGQVNTGLSTFTAPKNSLEWSINITEWPFNKTSNSLLLEFGLSHFNSSASAITQNQFILSNVTYFPQEKSYRYTLRTPGVNGTTVNLILPRVATMDMVAREINAPVMTTSAAFAAYLKNPNGQAVSSLQATIGAQVDVVVFTFPSFTKSLTYDPNVGFLLTGEEGSGGSDDHTLLIVLTTVLVSCALLVVIAAAVAVYVTMKVKTSHANQEACVQFEQHEDQDNPDAL